jgi:hypothetical protein
MIDQEMRTLAAYLISEFRTGALGIEELDSRWPYSAYDAALVGILATLLFVFDAVGSAGTEVEPVSDDAQLLLDRCIRFLRSDRPYVWAVGAPSSGERPLPELALDERCTNNAFWPFAAPEDIHGC